MCGWKISKLMIEAKNSVVFNEDCMAVMARYPDRYFDVAVCDIPYGIGVREKCLS